MASEKLGNYEIVMGGPLPVQTEPTLRVGNPERIFGVKNMRRPNDARAEFAVTSDGQRFIVLQFAEPEARFHKIEVIQNLPEPLRRRSADR